jgi:hypothetical protein
MAPSEVSELRGPDGALVSRGRKKGRRRRRDTSAFAELDLGRGLEGEGGDGPPALEVVEVPVSLHSDLDDWCAEQDAELGLERPVQPARLWSFARGMESGPGDPQESGWGTIRAALARTGSDGYLAVARDLEAVYEAEFRHSMWGQGRVWRRWAIAHYITHEVVLPAYVHGQQHLRVIRNLMHRMECSDLVVRQVGPAGHGAPGSPGTPAAVGMGMGMGGREQMDRSAVEMYIKMAEKCAKIAALNEQARTR